MKIMNGHDYHSYLKFKAHFFTISSDLLHPLRIYSSGGCQTKILDYLFDCFNDDLAIGRQPVLFLK